VRHDEQEDAELQALARQLGERGAANRLDPERTAQAVLARLREAPLEERRATRFGRPMLWLQIAAMIVVVLGSSLLVRLVRSPESTQAATTSEPGLSDLSTGELRDILRTVDDSTVTGATSADSTVGLDDLSAPELRRLLQSLEG